MPPKKSHSDKMWQNATKPLMELTREINGMIKKKMVGPLDVSLIRRKLYDLSPPNTLTLSAKNDYKQLVLALHEKINEAQANSGTHFMY